MSSARVASLRSISSAIALLCAVAVRADAQQTRDAHLTVSATVIASATRIAHAEVFFNALSSSVTGPLECEVQALVTSSSSGESTLSLVPRVDGVTVDVIGADGRATPIGALGVRVARTSGGEVSAALRLRIRAGSPELLDLAARAPVSLIVDSASR